MSLQKPRTRRHFTATANAAALEARRRKREDAVPRDTPGVYVVRLPDMQHQFGWEIRRFGVIVLDKSHTQYPTTRNAYAAGHEALAAQSVES